jgi:hypothetical protein
MYNYAQVPVCTVLASGANSDTSHLGPFFITRLITPPLTHNACTHTHTHTNTHTEPAYSISVKSGRLAHPFPTNQTVQTNHNHILTPNQQKIVDETTSQLCPSITRCPKKVSTAGHEESSVTPPHTTARH